MWLGRIVRPLGRPLLSVLFRVRQHDRELVPPQGGAVLAGNHRSYMDPIILWCVAPRFVHFMAKDELFKGFFGWALPRLWAFPVNRAGADRAAIAQATAFLEAGDLVGIFPEGTRGTEEAMGGAHGGAAFIAIRAGVPLVPIAFVGTEKVWPKGERFPKLRRVTVRYGRPIMPDDFPPGSRREQVSLLTELIMQRIGEEIDEAKKVH
jgi:1-acyl-sn-glycerol-3-phosphate acyltransferase